MTDEIISITSGKRILHVYYDRDKKQVCFSARARDDLGVRIGGAETPLANPFTTVDFLLRAKGMPDKGVTIITTPLE